MRDETPTPTSDGAPDGNPVTRQPQPITRRRAVCGLLLLPWAGSVLHARVAAVPLTALVSGCRREEPDLGPTMVLPAPGPIPRDSLDPQIRTAATRSLRRAIDFLWRHQVEDGSLPSRTYEVLQSGQSTTAFALLALLRVPAQAVPLDRARAERALDHLFARIGRRGAIGFDSDVPDYPCYATSMALSCAAVLARPGWKQRWSPALSWLDTQQFNADRGWGGHPAEGGWGMGSATRPEPPEAGHVDLSMTRRALEALSACGYGQDHASLAAARTFVLRCQTSDGSFIYSPVLLRLNKGEGSPSDQRGYGSATTDGILALLAMGYPRNHPEVVRASDVLRAMHRSHENPGVGSGIFQGFREALKGYYRAGASCVFARLGGPPGWRDDLVRAVTEEQRSDGSWLNRNRLQNEDDPLVATSHAVVTLSGVLAAEDPGP